MSPSPERAGADGGVVLVLHSHLPYVLGHGVWPHGEHWLLESAVECYLPMIAVCRKLQAEGLRGFLTISVTPVLAAQLADRRFPALLDAYLRERADQAGSDAAAFGSHGGSDPRRELALAWAAEFESTRRFFAEEIGGDIPGAWRALEEQGAVEILTSGLTHGYLPLLLLDECVAGQVRGGAATHERLFGRRPRGIWLPECAYRPRYAWRPPGGGKARLRMGVEQMLEEAELEYFVADSHALDRSRKTGAMLRGDPELEALYRTFRLAFGARAKGGRAAEKRSPGRPYFVRTRGGGPSRVAVLVRDARTGTRVWNREVGYPGNAEYLDFSKQHFGGLRYWRVTDRAGPIEEKEVYDPRAALARARGDARAFALEVAAIRADEEMPLVVAAYDTELFGHWWREGPVWLEHLIRELNASGVHALTGSGALTTRPPEEGIELPECSWGEGGFHWVWYNWMTKDLWPLIYRCERDFVRLIAEPPAVVARNAGRDDRAAARVRRLLTMLAQELVLVESSDWPFLVTGGAAREYARSRLVLHAERFAWLYDRIAHHASVTGAAAELEEDERARRQAGWGDEDERHLRGMEEQDGVLAEVDFDWWRPAGAGATPAARSPQARLVGGEAAAPDVVVERPRSVRV